MGKFYSALLDAVKQRLLKSSCSTVTKMTMFAKAVDVFPEFLKLLARDWHFPWCCKLLEQRKYDQSSCHSSVHSLQFTSSSASVSAALMLTNSEFNWSSSEFSFTFHNRLLTTILFSQRFPARHWVSVFLLFTHSLPALHRVSLLLTVFPYSSRVVSCA